MLFVNLRFWSQFQIVKMFREHIILAAFLLQREVFYTPFKKSVNAFLQFCILALSIPLIQLFIPSSCLVVLVLVIHILFSFLVTKLSHLCFFLYSGVHDIWKQLWTKSSFNIPLTGHVYVHVCVVWCGFVYTL